MLKGKSESYKKCVLDCIHQALIESFHISDTDRFQRILEYEPENFETAPSKTKDFLLIELTIFPGRSKDQKKDAIERITQKLGEELGVVPTDIFIIFIEPPLENWGMAGKQKG